MTSKSLSVILDRRYQSTVNGTICNAFRHVVKQVINCSPPTFRPHSYHPHSPPLLRTNPPHTTEQPYRIPSQPTILHPTTLSQFYKTSQYCQQYCKMKLLPTLLALLSVVFILLAANPPIVAGCPSFNAVPYGFTLSGTLPDGTSFCI